MMDDILERRCQAMLYIKYTWSKVFSSFLIKVLIMSMTAIKNRTQTPTNVKFDSDIEAIILKREK